MSMIKIRANAGSNEWIGIPVATSNTEVPWENIINKPTEFTPDQHANTHAAGGSDPITPASIGITPSITELSHLEGVTSNVQTQMNAKAPLASPTLTGTPTAPTASVGTNTTQIATTAFVVAEVTAELDALVGTAPETLNTIHEIATALSDNVDAIEILETTAANKQATITGAATTITDSNLTASRALVSDGSGKVGVSAVTSTELGYLDGVTSSIQTQLNDKQDDHIPTTATLTTTGWSNKSQSVSVTGVTANNTVIVAPAPTSQDAYGEAKVKCTAQATNSLTFVCEDVPSANLTVNIVILGV